MVINYFYDFIILRVVKKDISNDKCSVDANSYLLRQLGSNWFSRRWSLSTQLNLFVLVSYILI